MQRLNATSAGVAPSTRPLLGGFFVDNLSWALIFCVNLPIGIIAFGVLAVVLTVPVTRARHEIDYLGVGLLAAGLASIVMFTSLGGTSYDWSSPLIIGLMAASVILLVAFVLAESRAAEPVLPLSLFRNEVFPVASAVGFIVGLAGIGSASAAQLAQRVGRDRERLRGSFRALVERGLVEADSPDPEHGIWTVTLAGSQVLDRLSEARREGITNLLADWSPELHSDILRLIDELSTSLAEEAPHDAEQPVAT